MTSKERKQIIKNIKEIIKDDENCIGGFYYGTNDLDNWYFIFVIDYSKPIKNEKYYICAREAKLIQTYNEGIARNPENLLWLNSIGKYYL